MYGIDHCARALNHVFLAMACILLATMTTLVSMEAQAVQVPGADRRPAFVEGELLVRFKGGKRPSSAVVKQERSRLGVSVFKFNRFTKVHRFRFPRGKNLSQIIRTLSKDPAVQFVERNLLYYPAVEPNDPRYANVNGVSTDKQKWVFDGLGADRNLNAEQAWELTTGRSDVVVAVIDSGVYRDHPDLASNIWSNPGEIPGNGLDDDGNGFVDDFYGWDFVSSDNDPNPDLGDGIDNDFFGGADSNVSHGTHAASAACASGNNAIGVTGAAWNCKLMSVKVFTDDGGATLADIEDAIVYAANNGADVINLSLTGGTSRVLETAVATAVSKGAVVVAAAGNSATPLANYPAALPGVISVGATASGASGSGNIAARAWFSQYGPTAVDVVAPGEDIFAASVGSVASGNPGQPIYDSESGTSFSTPLVAGLAALIISRARDAGVSLPNSEVESIIQDTAVDLPGALIGGNTWENHGRVDFLAALNAVPAPTNQPPVADAGADQSGAIGELFTFDGSGSTDPDPGDTLTYEWDFGDANLKVAGQVAAHSYSGAGTYTVTLTVTDSGGLTGVDTATVTVVDPNANVPPTAVASASPTRAEVNTSISFDGSTSTDSDGSIVSYAWDFDGDGAATDATTNHSFATPGTYQVSLTVTDDDGASDTATVSVTIDPPNVAPAARATASPTRAEVNTSISFDGSTSTDSDGSIVSYAWDFDGDGAATGATTNHSFATPGTYQVSLTVTDDDGASDTATVTVTIDPPNVAPTAVATASPTTAEVGTNISFDGSGSTDLDGSIVSYGWSFDDGGTATGETVSHSFAAAGTHSATLTVTDNKGASDAATVSVTVTAPPNVTPTAVASANPTTAEAGTNISFDGSASTDSDGSIVSHTWSFDDGGTATGATVSHSFSAVGGHSATLTVTDNDGATDTATVSVTINAANVAPTAVASASPTTAEVGTNISFDGSGSSDPDGSIVSYAWDFGDGATGTGATATHSFGAAGTYQVALTVTDNDGASGSATVTVTINASPPPPPSGGTTIYFTSTGKNVIPGVGTVKNEDIVAYDTATGAYSLYFDGSDVGLGPATLDAFTILANGDILFSVARDISFSKTIQGAPKSGVIDRHDIIRFVPSSLGSKTKGTFKFYFDGSDVGLTTSGENINGLSVDGNGALIISTIGAVNTTGTKWRPHDLLKFTPNGLGATTTGSWSLYFDGSDVGLGGSTEKVWAAHLASNGAIYLSTNGAVTVPGASGQDEDVLKFSPQQVGPKTQGSFGLFFDGSARGLPGGVDVSGLFIK